MKATLVFLITVIAIAALVALPWVYKSGFNAGAASISPPLESPADEANPDQIQPATLAEKAPQTDRPTSLSEIANSIEDLIDESPPPPSLDDRIDSLTAETSIEDALALWAEIDSIPPGISRKKKAFKFLKAFGETHGEDAFLSGIADSGPNALRRLGPLAAGWAKSQPTEAWAALLAASNNGAIRAVDLGYTIQEVSRTDLMAALDMVNDLQGSRHSRELKTLLSKQKTTSGFETLLQGSLQIESEIIREKSMLALFDAWSDFDFDGSLVAIEQLSDPEIARSSMHGILNSWAQRDGSEAFAYAMENQGDPNVDGALLSVAKNWLRSSTSFETEQVFDAISTMPDRDQVVFNLTSDLVAANPNATMSMVGEIEDPELRNRTYSKAVSYWSRNDIDGAENFALSQENGISKAAMLSTLSRGRMEYGGSLDVYADAIDGFESKLERQRILIGLQRNVNAMGARASEEHLAEVDSILNRYSSDMDNVTFMPDGRVRIRNSREKPTNDTPKP